MIPDASALAEFLLRTPRAASFEGTLTDPESDLHVPALCDVELAAALRRLSLARTLGDGRRAQVLADYADLPLTRHGHVDLLTRVLELRDNFSAYDATYVALAERLKGTVVTADRRLARAIRAHTSVDV